jgi:hypothetical protein
MNPFKLNQTEQETLERILKMLAPISKSPVNVIDCQGMKYDQYLRVVERYKRKGLVAIKPVYMLAGRERYNDFAVYHPSLKRSYAIECKLRTTNTVSPNELNKEVQIRKDNVLEKTMCFFLEGSYSEVKKDNLATVTDNCKVVYDLNDLVLV